MNKKILVVILVIVLITIGVFIFKFRFGIDKSHIEIGVGVGQSPVLLTDPNTVLIPQGSKINTVPYVNDAASYRINLPLGWVAGEQPAILPSYIVSTHVFGLKKDIEQDQSPGSLIQITTSTYEPYRNSDGSMSLNDNIVRFKINDIVNNKNFKNAKIIRLSQSKDNNRLYFARLEYTSSEGDKILVANSYLFEKDIFYSIMESVKDNFSSEEKKIIDDSVQTFRVIPQKN
jgi:hypothetical protein